MDKKILTRETVVSLILGEHKLTCNNDIMAPPSLVEQLFSEFGTFDEDAFDTNGWQSDYWMTIEIKGEEFNIHGCMYYGSFNDFSWRHSDRGHTIKDMLNDPELKFEGFDKWYDEVKKMCK